MTNSITYHTEQQDAVLACFSRNSGKQLTAGETWVSLMKKNAEVLKEGLR